MFVKIVKACYTETDVEEQLNKYLSEYSKNPNYEDISIKYINATGGTGTVKYSAMIVVREKGDARYAG